MPQVVHIDEWLKRSEPDYYTMYINAWIPYNAWFVKEYNDESDGKCLKQVCTTDNAYRNKIKALLTNTDFEGKEFRYHLSKIQEELKAHSIPENAPINLNNVLVDKNNKTNFQKDYRKYSYKWEYNKPQKNQCRCVVSYRNSTQNTLVTFDLNEWNEEELKNNDSYKNIDIKVVREKVLEYFYEIRPQVKVPIIVQATKSGHRPHNVIVIDEDKHLYFINDVDKISRAIIWLLYKLRNMIFHGQINPNKACMPIYEHAYNIQRLLIKELV